MGFLFFCLFVWCNKITSFIPTFHGLFEAPSQHVIISLVVTVMGASRGLMIAEGPPCLHEDPAHTGSWQGSAAVGTARRGLSCAAFPIFLDSEQGSVRAFLGASLHTYLLTKLPACRSTGSKSSFWKLLEPISNRPWARLFQLSLFLMMHEALASISTSQACTPSPAGVAILPSARAPLPCLLAVPERSVNIHGFLNVHFISPTPAPTLPARPPPATEADNG